MAFAAETARINSIIICCHKTSPAGLSTSQISGYVGYKIGSSLARDGRRGLLPSRCCCCSSPPGDSTVGKIRDVVLVGGLFDSSGISTSLDKLILFTTHCSRVRKTLAFRQPRGRVWIINGVG